MKKILFINVSETGSTGKIIKEINSVCKTLGVQTVLCVPKITETENPFTAKYAFATRLERALSLRYNKFTGNRFGGAVFSTRKLIGIIKKERPDIIHVHCINGNIVNFKTFFKFLSHFAAPVVLTHHAEFFYTANCDYAFDCEKWKTGCGNCRYFGLKDKTAKCWNTLKKYADAIKSLTSVSVSGWQNERAVASPVLSNAKKVTILNGVNESVFCPTDNDAFKAVRNGRKIILHATSSFDPKNTHKSSGYVIELAKRLKDKNVLVAVAGPHGDVSGLPDNLLFLGNVKNQKELAAYYSSADLTVITSKRETFCMIVPESLCCGTPVVGFMAGGPESIAIKEFSEFVPFGDIDALEKAVEEKWLNFKTPTNKKSIAEKSAPIYSAEKMAQRYFDLYKELTD